MKHYDLLNEVIVNIGKCEECGYEAESKEFPVVAEEELQGQIHCPKCNSEDVEI